jgi:hypothetical protein
MKKDKEGEDFRFSQWVNEDAIRMNGHGRGQITRFLSEN